MAKLGLIVVEKNSAQVSLILEAGDLILIEKLGAGMGRSRDESIKEFLANMVYGLQMSLIRFSNATCEEVDRMQDFLKGGKL